MREYLTERLADSLGWLTASGAALIVWPVAHPNYPLWAGLLFAVGCAYTGAGTGRLIYRLAAHRASLASRKRS